MLTYVIRRLLYSVVVLFAASFIIFFFVSVSNDPLSFLRMQPTASEITIQNITERKHLDEPIPVRYVYWVKDLFTNQFGTTTIGDRPILPDLTARDGTYAAARPHRRDPRNLAGRRNRGVLGVTPVQRLRLLGDHLQLHRLRDAGLLARADAPGALREHLLMVRRADLLHREPERHRSRHPASTSCSTVRSTSGCRSSS